MGRKKQGVGAFSVTVPMDIIEEVHEYMDKHDISRSRVTTLALEKFLSSKTKRGDYIAQQEDYRREIKELEKKLHESEKEIDRLTHNLNAMVTG